MRRSFTSAMWVFGLATSATVSSGCQTANHGKDAAVLRSAEPVAEEPGKILTECPSYVYDAKKDDKVGAPDGVVGHPGLPMDLRDKDPALDPYGFGCYGACGPSCKAQCFSYPDLTRVYQITYADGKESLRKCTYARTQCRSDEMCRLHDDCYRQADLKQWVNTEDLGQPLSTFGVNDYRLCDEKPAKAEAWKLLMPPFLLNLSNNQKICWARYAQGIVPDDVNDCWDQTHAAFATLKYEEKLAAVPQGPDAPSVINLKRDYGSMGINLWELATNGDGSAARGPFEAVRATCVEKKLRLPTIEELGQAAATGKLPAAGRGCLWSATSTIDVLNGRMTWQLPLDSESNPATTGLSAQGPDSACAAVCVNAGGSPIGDFSGGSSGGGGDW